MWELYLAKVQVAGVMMAAIITALGTLIAGGAAVYGAWRLGKRQADISKELATAATNQTEIQRQQSQILAGQLELDRHRAKADLFDRRMAVYSSAREWVDELLRTGNAPNDEFHTNFGAAMDAAAFLFPVSISDYLRELYDDGNALRYQMNLLPFRRNGIRVSEIKLKMLHRRSEMRQVFSEVMGIQDNP